MDENTKEKDTKDNKDQTPITKVSEQEVFNSLQYAQKYFNGWNEAFKLIGLSGVHTPKTINEGMKRTTNTPIKPTESQLIRALDNALSSEKQLVSYSDFFAQRSIAYKREIHHLGNLPSFDLEFDCINPPSSINGGIPDKFTKTYQADLKRVRSFLYQFNYQDEFKKMLRQMLRHESVFTVLRYDSINKRYTLQELPNDFCTIDGRWSMGYVYSFDLNWFTEISSIDWEMYPSTLVEQYVDIIKNKSQPYNPGANVSDRGGSYVYYVQLQPEDNYWAFKFVPETVAQIPFFSPLLLDFALRDVLRGLQTNKYMIDASQILIGLIGTHNNNKTGNSTDNLKLSPEQAGMFSNLIRQALGDEIKFASAPFEDVLSIKGDTTVNNIYADYNKNIAKDLGGASSAIYPQEKPNAVETNYSIEVDEMLMTSIYAQFEYFLDYYINRLTKTYKFKFKFVGTNNASNKSRRQAEAKEMVSLYGAVDPQRLASSYGYNYFQLVDRLEQGNTSGFRDLLAPLETAYTKSNNNAQDEGGRPSQKEEDLSDAGLNTRGAGSNIEKGGET